MSDRFDDLKDTMKEGFSGIHERLDRLNGQVSDHKRDIGILFDRDGRSRGTAIKWGAGAGTAILALLEGASRLFGQK